MKRKKTDSYRAQRAQQQQTRQGNQLCLQVCPLFSFSAAQKRKTRTEDCKAAAAAAAATVAALLHK